ncbi:hypothetical protein GP486_004125 [Trichoglossum hirsutum]|uniref:Uncharacterized protein n=1 Tax=Trichoglossum hirsutum TaxID=265104 RepID=A0A9P8LBY1_9PEZI|nr:hypothetical protein GP486_004125 [Trichoglossum hirsutum]
MATRASDLPRASPTQLFVLDRRYLSTDMASISAAEKSEYETAGFVVLRERIDPQLIREVRDAVAERVEEARKTKLEDKIFKRVCEEKNWPTECQTLYGAIEKSVPPAQFCPLGSKLRIYSLIGVYQPNRIEGRGAPNAIFFTTQLDGEIFDMPVYYKGSYINGIPVKQTKESLRLGEGDILVWNGGTVMENEGKGGGSFMLIKHSWD